LATAYSCKKTTELSPQAQALEWQANQKIIEDTYIVKFKIGFMPNAKIEESSYDLQIGYVENFANAFLKNNGILDSDINHSYTGNYVGFNATMSKAEAEKLRNNPNVEFVENDKVITLANETTSIPSTTISTQNTPWGVIKVGGPVDATGKVVYVVDTGISMGHPDLNVKIDLCKSFVSSERNAEDGHGHGTHVAGIIAAKSNLIGTIGVAANATVVGIKVLSRAGVGTNSGVIAGLNYVGSIAKPGEVCNVSLGTAPSLALDAAVMALAAKGIRVVMAAGNGATGADGLSPGRSNGSNLYTVSAFDSQERLATFSNYGQPPIDYAEPGVGIYSCYKNGTYATMSGTSMAAPHLSGLLIVTNGNIKNGGILKLDKDAFPDVIGKR
jgi:subtilisin family serine protease